MSITEVSRLAELANAALASYTDISSSALDPLELSERGSMTQTQASQFLDAYSVLHQQGNTASGFSATIFSSRRNPNQIVLAIRGTEFTLSGGYADVLSADLNGVVNIGIANLQAIDLYRYWRRLTTVGGKAVQYSDQELLQSTEHKPHALYTADGCGLV